MKYQRYPKYRDSGVDWLGEVPIHWEVKRLKFIARYLNSNVDKKSHEKQEDVRLCNYTDVYYNEKITNNMDFMVATATDDEIKSMSLKQGDVMITKDSEDPADIGIPAIVSEPLDNVVCGYHLTVLRTKSIDASRFLHRAIQSHPTKAHFYIGSPGITRFGLNQDAIGGLALPVPTITERMRIADFLDGKTSQIDQLIEKKTRFIELLREKRQALITQAVTKGLNPDVEMKASKIDWIKSIPADWTYTKLKFQAIKIIDTEHKTIPFTNGTNYLVVRTSDIRDGALLHHQCKETDTHSFKKWTRRGKPSPGDIIFTREAPVGEACIVPPDLNICLGQRTVLIKIGNELLPEYLLLVLSSNITKEYIELSSMGSTVKHLNMADIPNIPFYSPNIDAQKQIVHSVKVELRKLDQLKKAVQHSIDLLKEHRSALITAAVTGQIDLREDAA